MIYSRTQFAGLAGEPELLRIRLAEELPFVDKFVIIEGDHTFSGKPKRITLPDYEDIWARPKVEAIKVTFNKIDHCHTWNNGILQQNVLQDLKYKPDDIIIWTDLDEVNNAKDMPTILNECSNRGYVHIGIHNHCYFINYFGRETYRKILPTSFAVTGAYLKSCKQTFRQLRREWTADNQTHSIYVVETDGHHLDYMVQPEDIMLKFDCLAARTYRRSEFYDIEYIKKARKYGWDHLQRRALNGRRKVWYYEPFDSVKHTYPASLLANIKIWQPYIRHKKWGEA